MKVLVFGKTGQVATELQRQAEVVTLDRSAADLMNPAACADVIAGCDADVIINAAAYTAVDAAETDEASATTVNGTAPAEMALAAARAGIPFIHLSTDYVFNGTGTAPWVVGDETGPLGAYGRSKLLGETGVRAAGGPHAILRTSWVFSAHGNNFVKSMLKLASERDSLSIVADQVGGPTAAADIAAACLTIARAFHQGKGASGTFHFAGAPDVSWADFAREIFTQSALDIAVHDIPTSDFPRPAKRPANSRLDCSAIQAAYGIARPDWKASLAAVLSELKTH